MTTMTFTLEELEDIYQTYLAYGVIDNQKVLMKINTQFTFCTLCNHLILNDDYKKHFDEHQF